MHGYLIIEYTAYDLTPYCVQTEWKHHADEDASSGFRRCTEILKFPSPELGGTNMRVRANRRGLPKAIEILSLSEIV